VLSPLFLIISTYTKILAKTSCQMKNILFFLIIAILSSSCSKTKTDYWPNGNKKSELKYYNGKLDGVSTWWHESGIKQMECNYKDNLLEGKSTRWYFDGNLQSEDHYKNNLLNGKTTNYYESGKKKAELNYINDTLSGESKEWHENGQIKITGSYKKGMYDGKWEYCENTGIKVGEGEFKEGTGIQKGFYPEGKLKREMHYINNKKNGLEIWFSKNNDTIRKIVYENDHIIFEKNY
jgi:antitoxin component YwqK of YwqJK toxin-antitoxin module